MIIYEQINDAIMLRDAYARRIADQAANGASIDQVIISAYLEQRDLVAQLRAQVEPTT